MPSTAETTRKTPAKRETRHEITGEQQAVTSKQGLRMHTLDIDAPLHIPYFTPGDVLDNARTATSWLPPLPPARELAFYGGLGALAVAGALEWPVAVAIGGATLVVRRKGAQARAEQRAEEQRSEERRATGRQKSVEAGQSGAASDTGPERHTKKKG